MVPKRLAVTQRGKALPYRWVSKDVGYASVSMRQTSLALKGGAFPHCGRLSRVASNRFALRALLA